jgi:hypothetical protein
MRKSGRYRTSAEQKSFSTEQDVTPYLHPPAVDCQPSAAISRAIAVDISDGESRTRGPRGEIAVAHPPPPPHRRPNPAAARVSVPRIAPGQDIRPAPARTARPKPN